MGRSWRRWGVVAAGLVLLAAAGRADEAAETGGIRGRVVDAGSGAGLPAATVTVQDAGKTAVTGGDGAFEIGGIPPGSHTVVCSRAGYQTRKVVVSVSAGRVVELTCRLPAIVVKPDEKKVKDEARGDTAAPVAEPEAGERELLRMEAVPRKKASMGAGKAAPMPSAPRPAGPPPADFNTEQYDSMQENAFHAVLKEPLSTFSIDVDTASYANVRRFLLDQKQLPPRDAVRIEELVNYFSYDYPEPRGEHPFSITTEISSAPWNPKHRLLMIGLQGTRVETGKMPRNNLVFLLDVSGSMNSPDKLPLLKKAFRLLVENLRKEDRVAIVVYAGAAGLVLPSTPAAEAPKILDALERLQAGGSTAGAAGIQLAYRVAQENFVKDGNNRIILATDGDFNVGVSSDGELVRLVEEKRKAGVFLTVLGLGRGNVKDSRMEKLADKGNGNYAYIDSVLEARKVLVTEMGGTLLTIAKDVKIQIEFNPARVKGYRLVGYENRVLRNEDFNDDTRDAGELGSGHSVTAFYELIPAGSDEALPGVDALKYQDSAISDAAKKSPELATVKFRYKPPKEDVSNLITVPVLDKDVHWKDTSRDFRFASAVVEFGLLLRGSEFKGSATFESLIARAKTALGEDPQGYRAGFLTLAAAAEALSRK